MKEMSDYIHQYIKYKINMGTYFINNDNLFRFNSEFINFLEEELDEVFFLFILKHSLIQKNEI